MKRCMTTMFWVGEPSDAENKFIPNHESYWDENWLEHFGGPDNPDKVPLPFTPKENPFYCALPYGELKGSGNLKKSALKIPWYSPNSTSSLLKNRWIHVIYRGKSCFAQWEDVGPNNEKDWDWVFGTAEQPLSSFNNYAGLDLSPACFRYLGIEDNDYTEWEHYSSAPPEGPWLKTVTGQALLA
jgi:hypothetical protein